MAIRVLRILEYTYETPEQASSDMSRWTTSLNLGTSGAWMRMKSITMPFDAVDWHEAGEDDDPEFM